MRIDSVLKREGIEDVKPLDTLSVNKIASSIAKKLSNTFSEHNLDESDLFISISRLKMYFAKMPQDLSGAKYFSRNNAIYFNDQLDISQIEEFAIHECIHYLQEIKDEKDNLVRLGLCDLKTDGEKSIAINEAAVQLMTAEASEAEEDKVKYYDIFLATKSPNYYPLECVLLNEMTYFTGKYPLYHSTLYSDDVFKNSFSGKYGLKTYKYIEKNIATILDLETLLNNESMILQYTNSERKARKVNKFVEECKAKIAKIFIKTQDYIMEKCFKQDFEKVRNLEDLQYFKDKLYGFKNIIGYTADYQTYNDFYIQMMKEFEIKKEYIENYGDIKENNWKNARLDLVDTQKKEFSFIKRILVKLGILVGVNQKVKSYNRNDM